MVLFLTHYKIVPYASATGERMQPEFGEVLHRHNFDRDLPAEYIGEMLPVRRINWEQTFRHKGLSLNDYDFVAKTGNADRWVYRFKCRAPHDPAGRSLFTEVYLEHTEGPDARSAVRIPGSVAFGQVLQGSMVTCERLEPALRLEVMTKARVLTRDVEGAPIRAGRNWLDKKPMLEALCLELEDPDGFEKTFLAQWDDQLSLLWIARLA